ncbi:MAG: FemAB family XrtA/PEP-CTERM system-associated protein [Planctomycetota bacterium]
MIEYLRQPDPATVAAVRELIANPNGPAKACGEHDPAWLDILRDGLGHKTVGLLTRRGSQVTGYLPLALTRSPLFGRHLVSLPYLNRAGVLANSDDTAASLIDAAVRLADQQAVRYLELRHHGHAIPHDQLGTTRGEKVRMVLDLPDTGQALWERLKAKVRNQVRKGDKHGLAIRFGGRELLGGFYSVFAANMRDLGTPVYPRRLFSAMLEHLAGRCELVMVTMEGSAIAGAVLIHDRVQGKGITQVPSASCLRQFNDTCANMWMYHKLLERAVERGASRFDFGRSSEGSGTYRFKKQWGAEPEATPWQVYLRQGDLDAARPDHPCNRRRVEAWQKLPVWVTRVLGPQIVRGIP